MADSFQEKTEQPTEKRLADARKKGQVAQSPELASSFVILFISIFLYYALSKGFTAMSGTYSSLVRNLDIEMTPATVTGVFSFAAHQWVMIVAPVFAFLVALAVISSFLQTGFMWSFEAMRPKMEVLNPLSGINKLVSKKAFFEVLKALVKIGALGYVSYSLITKELPVILSLSTQETISIIGFIAKTCFSLAMKVGAIFLFVAGLDYLRQRWQQNKDLMMTLQEVKEEAKEREGNPLVKSRIRSLQRELARRRMIEDVKKADFVVTNPTTFAIAIRYAAGEMPAPKIVAKGAGFVAQKIKEVAVSHGVMILENKPVARGLFYAVKVGDYIPEKFYMIVAELLAQVYKRKNRAVL
jgi:flagellar biosynthesis protein FlhB